MNTHARVLLAGGEETQSAALRALLTSAGHEVARSSTTAEAELRLAHGEADVVVLANPEHAVRDLERLVGAACLAQGVAFVVVATNASAGVSREATRLGANEVVDRAAGDDALLLAVERATRDAQLRRELAMLRVRVGEEAQHALVGRSSGMARVRELVGRAAASRVTVLITGEAGTGKDAVARLVHDLSDRAARPYVSVRCGHGDAQTLELELFGRAGAGATHARAGLLEEARGGTVVLDDAWALSSSLRVQLARVAATRTTRRVGGEAAIPADVRLIFTSRIADGAQDESHEDLLARFNALPVLLPPLRERRSDIPQLVQHFRRRFAAEQGVELDPLGPDQMLPLLGHEWSGNVRELEHWVERTALAATKERPASRSGVDIDGLGGLELGSARATLEQLERVYILHVLDQEQGHQSRAAVRLGIDRRTLYRKLKQYRSESVELQRAG